MCCRVDAKCLQTAQVQLEQLLLCQPVLMTAMLLLWRLLLAVLLRT
jgi:hypothetical protein